MDPGRVQHGALERDAILGALRIGLHRGPVIRHGRVPIADAREVLALAERLAGRAAAEQRDGQNERGDPR
jgi:hypothetical protein